MEISFLIVTKNRATDLQFTLKKLIHLIDFSKQEILIYIDGCIETEIIKYNYPQIKWFSQPYSISASPARNFLYQQARGKVLIGLDDDAHLITNDPIETIKRYFATNVNLGILAFLEIKGLVEKPEDKIVSLDKVEYLTTDFIGCGFAIRKSVYVKTNGFPAWMDIYGEETCLAIEVMNLNYDILFTNQVAVNHRIDIEMRKLKGRNYFRFKKQLQNSFRIYMIYYQNPIPIVLRLLVHNFKKYALSDSTYFKLYWSAVANMVWNLPLIFKNRNRMTTSTLLKLRTLKAIKY